MSDKTIADKMYLKTARSLVVINRTLHPQAVAQLPPDLLAAGEHAEHADAVLLFALNHKQLAEAFPAAMARLGDKGSLWIAYLKPTAPKATDLTRDTINAFAKERGATVVALISLDADWSAARLKRM